MIRTVARCALRIAASLQLTLACLGLAMILILAGTFAQVDQGLYRAQELYFRSLFVWHDFGPVQLPVLPGGYLLGGVLVSNLLAAHLRRFQWSLAKLGIHLVHLGLLLLILSQLASDYLSVESRMTLDVGETRNWSESAREAELVFTDSSNPETNTVVCLDQRALRPGRSITDAALPFRVDIKSWTPNAVLRTRSGKRPSTAARGAARVFDLVPQPQATRLDRRDLSAVAFDLVDPSGRSLGEWLASLQLDEPQSIPGTSWSITMRPRRHQLSFALTLDRFVHDRHPGIDIASRFASRVTLRDATGGTRPVDIHMNHPLRIDGRTVYQGAFANDDRTSILQVVQNTGWVTPYVACGLVILGLLIQFGHHLLRAVRAPREPSLPRKKTGKTRRAALCVENLMPALALLFVGVFLMFAWRHHVAPAGRLGSVPIQAGGRVQPLDAFAADALTLISGKSSVGATSPPPLSALDWFLAVIADPASSDALPIFRITHPEVLALTGQPPGKSVRLSFDQLRPLLDSVRDHAASAAELSEKDPYRRAMLQLDGALHTYAAMRLSFRAVTDAPSLAEELAVYGPLVPHAIENAEAWEAGRPFDEGTLSRFVTLGRAYRDADRLALVQPAWPFAPVSTKWMSLPGALLASANARQLDPAPGLYAAVFQRPADPAAIDALVKAVVGADPPAAAHARSESLFRSLDLFTLSRILYLAAFLLAASSWLVAPVSLRTAAQRIALLAFLLNSIGLIWRVALLGRPPVTNLYSSALFVAWVAVGLGLFAERFNRDGLATAASSALGFASLLIAHHLAATGDTMGVLIAVLDSNYWLATHVVSITIGYAATFLAGFLGLAYLVLRAASPRFDASAAKRLAGMIYGVVCFALLFSFLGTILGGIWADQSWGRFWGWDPKENGALLIVLWNAIILHARWGGFVRGRGLAVLAVLGNIVTAFSWFGTNLLGIGLHSYGLTESGFLWLTAFCASQLLVALFTAVPPRYAAP